MARGPAPIFTLHVVAYFLFLGLFFYSVFNMVIVLLFHLFQLLPLSCSPNITELSDCDGHGCGSQCVNTVSRF